MCQEAQLNLAVVDCKEDRSLARRKRRLDGTAQLGARRDVLQVGIRRGQATRRRDGLVVRGVHAAVPLAQRAQRIQIGRLNLGHLAIFENQTHDLVVASKLLEFLGVGGVVATLGLLQALGGQAHHVEQDMAELHRTRDVERIVTRK